MMLCIVLSLDVCLSVRLPVSLSVTHQNCVEMAKHIFSMCLSSRTGSEVRFGCCVTYDWVIEQSASEVQFGCCVTCDWVIEQSASEVQFGCCLTCAWVIEQSGSEVWFAYCVTCAWVTEQSGSGTWKRCVCPALSTASTHQYSQLL